MKALFVALLIILPSLYVSAAEELAGGEIFGALGVAVLDDARFVTDKYTNFGFGFGLAYRASSHLGFRGDINHLKASDESTSYPYKSKIWDFGGDFIYYFSDGKNQPYAFAGVRLLNYHQTSDAPSLPGIFEETVNSLGLDFGAGIQTFVSPSVSVRPEFRLVYDTDLVEHNEAHSYIFNFTVGIGYHW